MTTTYWIYATNFEVIYIDNVDESKCEHCANVDVYSIAVCDTELPNGYNVIKQFDFDNREERDEFEHEYGYIRINDELEYGNADVFRYHSMGEEVIGTADVTYHIDYVIDNEDWH